MMSTRGFHVLPRVASSLPTILRTWSMRNLFCVGQAQQHFSGCRQTINLHVERPSSTQLRAPATHGRPSGQPPSASIRNRVTFSPRVLPHPDHGLCNPNGTAFSSESSVRHLNRKYDASAFSARVNSGAFSLDIIRSAGIDIRRDAVESRSAIRAGRDKDSPELQQHSLRPLHHGAANDHGAPTQSNCSKSPTRK